VVDLNPDDPQRVEVEFHVEDGSRYGRSVERIVAKEDLEAL